MRIAFIVLAAMIPAGAVAHHGWSTYDDAKPVTVTGSLTNLTWANPHVSANVVRGDQTWVAVLAPVIRMEARGLTKDMLADAKEVTLSGLPRRDGTHEMKIERIKLRDRTFEIR